MTQPSYKRWRVSGYDRPARDQDAQTGEWFATRETEPVVIIEDGDRTYEVTVGVDSKGEPRLTSLAISGAALINQDALRSTPLSYLAEAALGYLRRVAQGRDEGLRAADAHEAAGADEGGVRLPGDAPTAEEFAARWLATPAFEQVPGPDGGLRRVSRREALAEHYGRTVWAVDKWSRAAREAGLIERQKSGRPVRRKRRRSTGSSTATTTRRSSKR